MKKFFLKCLLLLLPLYLLSNFILSSDAVIFFLDRYRPMHAETRLPTFVQKQMLHIEALTRLPTTEGRIVFAGSSSVVNGIDAAAIKDVWRAQNLPFEPLNFGLTAFQAYELPFLKGNLLEPKVKAVIYLYNLFSFGNNVHPQASATRWNAYEFLKMSPPKDWFKWQNEFWSGTAGQMFFAVRLRTLLAETMRRYFTHTLKAPDNDYDYPVDEPQATHHVATKNETASAWLAENGGSPSEQTDTMGYRGLARFLELAKRAGITVVVAPIPEPDFANRNSVNESTHIDWVDRQVDQIVRDQGMVFLPRSEIRGLEANGSLFRDSVHLHSTGRGLYSKWLAKRLIPLVSAAAGRESSH